MNEGQWQTLSELPRHLRATGETVALIRRIFDQQTEELIMHLGQHGNHLDEGHWFIYITQGRDGHTGHFVNGNAASHTSWIQEKKRLMTALDPLLTFDKQWPVHLKDVEMPSVLTEDPMIAKHISNWINGETVRLYPSISRAAPRPTT